MGFIWFILVGIAAGYLGSRIYKGEGSGLFLNLLLGIVGGVVGGWAFSLMGFATTSIIGNLITAVVGAVIVLWLYHKLFK